MNNLQHILELAHQRSEDNRYAYTGALRPKEAFEVLQANPKAVLIDVRTQAELELVGRIPGTLNIEWATYPGMVANPNFSKQLTEQLDQHGIEKNQVLIFMCRTGGRSHNAASVAMQLGFNHVYNMLEGFEGEANPLKQRTLINGWKFAGLPWAN